MNLFRAMKVSYELIDIATNKNVCISDMRVTYVTYVCILPGCPPRSTGFRRTQQVELEQLLPSRSALSDLGLIADLFEKMLLNWSSFCLKSLLFWPKKSDFQFFSLIHKAKKYL